MTHDVLISSSHGPNGMQSACVHGLVVYFSMLSMRMTSTLERSRLDIYSRFCPEL